jgi:sortase A
MSQALARELRLQGWQAILLLCLVLTGLQQLGAAAVIKAKAGLAPVLIARAWEQTLASGGAPVKPWPWADTWPVARLRVPTAGVELLVLAGDSGNALAFGPGHAWASAPLGSPGQAVIAGHRDTHFAFLRQLQPGTGLQLQLPSAELRSYRTGPARLVDSQQQRLSRGGDGEALLLVTCYPFDTLRVGGPLRYVVSAWPEPAQRAAEDMAIMRL